MKPLVIYYTKTNNTTAVAATVADTLNADLVNIRESSPAQLGELVKDRPLICLGTGIYNTCPAKPILKLLPQLPKDTKVFIFFTSGFVNKFLVRLYKSRFRKWLARSEVELVGMWNAPGHDKYPLLKWANIHVGRPDENDLRRLRSLLESLE
jgi:flavodoxin